jgi:4,5-dihydroxyphthalate decarboxylase
MLLAGELDMVIAARAPRAFRSGGARMRRLFPQPRAEERAYFAATGIVPIMHVVVVRRSLAEVHPWLPNTLRGAFTDPGKGYGTAEGQRREPQQPDMGSVIRR